MLQVRECIQADGIPRCEACGSLVKPDIVFFGTQVAIIGRSVGRSVGRLVVCFLVYECVAYVRIPNCVPVHPGEGLPQRFFQLKDADLKDADLLIVAGTSLQVAPVSSLVRPLSVLPLVIFDLCFVP
jgi:NAD-dependent SIR2 family protein deacetylase